MSKKTRNSVGQIADVRALAPSNPELAFAIWSGFCTPQVIPMSAQLLSGAKDETVDASTFDAKSAEGFCSDFAILSAKFQIQRTAAFAGSILKGQSDYYNAKNSGIHVWMEAAKCPKFEIVPNYTPIELVCDAADAPDSCCTWPYGFVMPACSGILAHFINRRALAPGANDGPSEELPYEIWIALRGYYLGVRLCDIDTDKAVAALIAAGMLPGA